MTDEIYMRRCLDLARNGLGKVSPNPLVGSVIVHNDELIGEGWHHKAGEAHAEVNAIASVANTSLLQNSTLYVNLEPCAHFGKTPPCADLIIANKIPRVVIANLDPHEAVAGKGIAKMREAGIEVITGVLEEKGRFLNRRFFCVHEKHRPYVILKWAESEDGFLDRERNTNEIGINWITQSETQSLVHKWRTEEDAIMIGSKTLINDDPLLTSRSFSGKNPIPIIVGSKSIDSSNYHLLQNNNTIWFSSSNRVDNQAAELILLKSANHNPPSWLEILHDRKVQSILVEGGASLIQSFLDSNSWDEIRVLKGQKAFHSGLKAPVMEFDPAIIEQFGSDILKTYYS